MKYDRMWAIEQYKRQGQLSYVAFWQPEGASGDVAEHCLCQWYPSRFEVDGVTYNTAEQYMMAQKALLFGDDFVFRAILDTEDPAGQKALGKAVSGFDEARWNAAKYDIVLRGNLAKFSQNPELAAWLAGTGERVLIEASPWDGIWGVKLTADDPRIGDPALWQGENLLGFALMEVRDRLSDSGIGA